MIYLVNEIDRSEDEIRINRPAGYNDKDMAQKLFDERLKSFKELHANEIEANIWVKIFEQDDYAYYEHVNGINNYELELGPIPLY